MFIICCTLHMGKCYAAKSHLLLTVPCCQLSRASSTVFFVSLYCIFAYPVGHIYISFPLFFCCQCALPYKLCAESESRFDSHNCTIHVIFTSIFTTPNMVIQYQYQILSYSLIVVAVEGSVAGCPGLFASPQL